MSTRAAAAKGFFDEYIISRRKEVIMQMMMAFRKGETNFVSGVAALNELSIIEGRIEAAMRKPLVASSEPAE